MHISDGGWQPAALQGVNGLSPGVSAVIPLEDDRQHDGSPS